MRGGGKPLIRRLWVPARHGIGGNFTEVACEGLPVMSKETKGGGFVSHICATHMQSGAIPEGQRLDR